MLIEVEGPSGAGKTSLIQALCATLRESHAVIDVAAWEHKLGGHGWQLGEFMRQLHLPLDHPEALFVYCARAAARARIIADLDNGRTLLLCDRLRLSLHVQAALSGLDWPEAAALVRWATSGVEVKYTVLLDIDYPTHSSRLFADGRCPVGEAAFDVVRQRFDTAYRQIDAPKAKINTAAMTVRQVEASILSMLRTSGAMP